MQHVALLGITGCGVISPAQRPHTLLCTETGLMPPVAQDGPQMVGQQKAGHWAGEQSGHRQIPI